MTHCCRLINETGRRLWVGKVPLPWYRRCWIMVEEGLSLSRRRNAPSCRDSWDHWLFLQGVDDTVTCVGRQPPGEAVEDQPPPPAREDLIADGEDNVIAWIQIRSGDTAPSYRSFCRRALVGASVRDTLSHFAVALAGQATAVVEVFPWSASTIPA